MKKYMWISVSHISGNSLFKHDNEKKMMFGFPLYPKITTSNSITEGLIPTSTLFANTCKHQDLIYSPSWQHKIKATFRGCIRTTPLPCQEYELYTLECAFTHNEKKTSKQTIWIYCDFRLSHSERPNFLLSV